jgi:hypothetical protein
MREFEVRGPLSHGDIQRLKALALERRWPENEYHQTSIYCDTDTVPAIGSVTGGRARIILDIRDSGLRMKVKIGNPLDLKRKEHYLTLDHNSLPGLIALLNLFGISNGYVRTFDRTDYEIDENTHLTLKVNCLMGNHFELERLSTGDQSISLDDLLSDFALAPWSREELAAAITEDHNKAASTNIEAALKNLKLI